MPLGLISGVIRFPNIRLPSGIRTDWITKDLVFAGLLFSYMLVTAGIVYDMINEPPSIGQTQDERGKMRPVTVMPNRINAQYIIEGICAGFMFMLGGIGFIIINNAGKGGLVATKSGLITLGVGITLLFLSYNIIMMFLRTKMPGYMN